MAYGKAYQDGFTLLECTMPPGGLRSFPIGSGVAVAKGDVLVANSGYIAIASTLEGNAEVLGIAQSDCTAAEASADGAVDILVLPILQQYQFIVPCEATDLITVAQVGKIYNLQSEDGIDEGDASDDEGYGFRVDAVDVSTEAVAAETFGYAIGHFEKFAHTT